MILSIINYLFTRSYMDANIALYLFAHSEILESIAFNTNDFI